MADVCHVEHKEIWCLIIVVALIIAQNSLSKALPGGIQHGHPKQDCLSHVLFLYSFSREGWVQQPRDGDLSETLLRGRNT